MDKSAANKSIYKSLIDRGYVEINSTLYPPSQVAKLIESGVYVPKKKDSGLKGLKSSRIKTGWIDDTLNIKNKEKQIDTFIALVKHETGLEVWPEFYFLTDRQYRFDYAIPINQDNISLRIAIECEGGIWAKGNSGHSSGKGIARDMDKSSKAAVQGWTLIRRTPSQLCHHDTIDLIKQAVATITAKAI